MDERLSRLESRLDDADRSLRRLEARVAALEVHAGGEPAVASPDRDPADRPLEPAAASTGGAMAQAGRILVLLAGGFLLRALTTAGYVPLPVGTALGMGYALLWTAIADRAAGRGSRATAQSLGLAAALIGFPLLAEATAKTRLLDPGASAAALAAFAGIQLAVAARHRLVGLAWIVVLLGLGHALALGGARLAFVPYAGTLIVLGGATLALACWRRWRLLAWLAALVLDGYLVFLAALVLFGSGSRAADGIDPGRLVGAQIALVAVYVAGFGAAAIVWRRDVGVFEILQTAAVTFIGLGGAALLGRAAGLAAWPLGTACLVLAAGGYGIAFALVERERRGNFLFFANAALVLALAAAYLLLGPEVRIAALSVLALVLAWLSGRTSRRTLSVHAALYATAAALSGGLLGDAVRAFLGAPPALATWGTVPRLLVLATAVVIVIERGPVRATTWGRLARLPKFLLFAVLAAAAAGVLVSAVARVLGSRAATDPGLLAALRTVILALAAVLLAVIGRQERTREAGWLAIPLLVLGGFKLLAQDFPSGRPFTMFLSLAALGGGLLLIARGSRRSRPVEPE